MKARCGVTLWLAAALCCLACVRHPAEAKFDFKAHRLLQYEEGGVAKGSWRAVLQPAPFADLSNLGLPSVHQRGRGCRGRVLVLRLGKLFDVSQVTEHLTSSQCQPGGLLLLAPNETRHPDDETPTLGDVVSQMAECPNAADCKVSKEQLLVAEKIREFERYLLSREHRIPVWVAVESEELVERLNVGDITRQEGGWTLLRDYAHLMSHIPEASKVERYRGESFSGWLLGESLDGRKASRLPTVMLVAHYDALSPFAERAHGLDGSGTGAVVLLELARIYGELYKRQRPPYNLLFVLTGGVLSSYNGLEQFLAHADTRLAVTVQFALCLDSIGGVNLSGHGIRKSSFPSEVIELLKNVSTTRGIVMSTKMRKTKADKVGVDWPHEVLYKHKIAALTLSHSPNLRSSNASASLLPVPLSATLTRRVIRNAHVVAESLATFLYNSTFTAMNIPKGENNTAVLTGASLIDGTTSINEAHIESWLDVFSQAPRFLPFMTPTTHGQLLKTFETTLSSFGLHDVRGAPFVIPKSAESRTFYRDMRTPTVLSIVHLKPRGFEALYLLVNVCVFYVILTALQPGNFNFEPTGVWFTLTGNRKSR